MRTAPTLLLVRRSHARPAPRHAQPLAHQRQGRVGKWDAWLRDCLSTFTCRRPTTSREPPQMLHPCLLAAPRWWAALATAWTISATYWRDA